MVYISSLKMERFGVWADLRLSSFSEGLNVIYGPNGSGKTTVVRFIGAVLYGFGDEVRQRYLPADAQAGGALTVLGSFGRRTILRRDDGPGRDRLIVENEDAAVGGMHRLQDLLGGVRQGVFERVFQVEFQGDLDVDKLIQTALAEGFDLLGSHAESDRAAELQDRLQSKRQALAEITTAEIAFDELVRRRRGLQQEAETLQASLHDRRASWERRLGQLDANIVDLEEQVESLDEELRSVGAQIEARQADRQGREASLLDARHRQLQLETQRRQGLREIDTQLERWRGVLQDLEDRSRRLRDQAGFAPGLELRADTDPRRYLRRLEDGLDRLQRSVADLAAAEPGQCQCATLRATLHPALAVLREDVYRLCNELSDWEVRSQQRDSHGELSQLQRCEGELRSAMAGLALQRHALLAELAANGDAEPVALPPDRSGLCHCQHHPRSVDAAPSCADEPLQDETLLHWDAELRRLIARRDMIRDDLSTLESELRDLRDQRRQVASECDPEFEEHRLKAKQQELDGIEVNLRQFERRRELMAAVTKLEEELRTLTAQVRTPAIVLEASELLRRLTDGELLKLTIDGDRSLWIHHRRGERLAYPQLGSGGREQVYLSLCLALVAAYARRGTRLPLILNDAFANIDNPGVATAAAVLRDYCQQGHQVLLFTRHQHVADRFRSLDVSVRQLPAFDRPRVAAPVKAVQAEITPTLSEINQQLNMIAEELAGPPPVRERAMWSSEEFPGELTDRVRSKTPEPSRDQDEPLDADLAAEFFLLETSPIQDAPSIDSATAERFRKIGVLFVRDLLRLDVAEAADRLRYAGITAPMIRRWQAESLLTCRIPRLRPYDARILVACGIATPEQLAQLEAAELRRRVEHFAETSTGDVLLRSGNRYELSRLTEWIHAARRDQQRNRATRDDSPRPSRSTHDRDERRRSPAARAVRQPTAGPERTRTREESKPVVLKMEQGETPLRFYLELIDPIEQAPSIGPRTAERLESIGVRTVADFLQADPVATAARLKRRSVDAHVIRIWQQQATLVCRVPWLRGHDAQILVACGVTDPEILAKLDAGSFWKTVQPFVQSDEAKRMLRSSKTPDLEEVTQWIQWAGHARTLRAA
jgi:energy-coupling factor transporter ATP-binding protein EcfA2